MWRWLAKHPGAMKKDWPGWILAIKDFDVWFVLHAAKTTRRFACVIAHEYCDNCPITDKAKRCNDKDSLWHQISELYKLSEINIEKWSDLCNQMADAWKEDYYVLSEVASS